MKKNRDYKIIIIIILIILFFIFYLRENFKYIFKYQTCDIGYTNCTTIAEFKDMNDCKVLEERGNWYCNSADKNNISCREAKGGEPFRVVRCTK